MAGHKKAIVVLGSHRSGTSAMAGALKLVGVDLGSGLIRASSDNPAGFWENGHIVSIHDDILWTLGFTWDVALRLPEGWVDRPEMKLFQKRLRDTIRRLFGDSEVWGVKDPRMCRLLPIWHDLWDQLGCDPYVIFVVRNPWEVAESLCRRTGPWPDKFMLMWLLDMLESERESRRYPRLFVLFDQVMGDPVATLERCSKELGISFPKDPAEVGPQVRSFLDPGLRHHSLAIPPGNHDLAAEAYDCLKSASTQGDWPLASAFSEIRDRFEQSLNTFVARGLAEEVRAREIRLASWRHTRLGYLVNKYNRVTDMLKLRFFG